MNDLSRIIQQHLAKKVLSTPTDHIPFEHLRLHDVFPSSIYDEILRNLPETRFYGDLQHKDALLADGRSARRKLELRPARLKNLPHEQRIFWMSVAQALTSHEVELAYRKTLSSALNNRFKNLLSQIKFNPAAMLLRDLGGYKISIHTDSMRKAITTQYYLPSDHSHTHLGTSFHKKGEAGFTKVRTLEFAPNSGYAFPVGNDSWHGVEKMCDSDGERNSIMLIYYVHQGVFGELFNHAKQGAQDLLMCIHPSPKS